MSANLHVKPMSSKPAKREREEGVVGVAYGDEEASCGGRAGAGEDKDEAVNGLTLQEKRRREKKRRKKKFSKADMEREKRRDEARIKAERATNESWDELGEDELNATVDRMKGLLREAVESLRGQRASKGARSFIRSAEQCEVGLTKGDPAGASRLQRPDEGNEEEEPDDAVEGSVDQLDPDEWMVPQQCIPIHANVTTYDWSQLYSVTQFDVIMMDPPWQLATANPTRGVSIGYSQLSDDKIFGLPFNKLQSNGFLFVWVINAKYLSTITWLRHLGYEVVDEIVWVKATSSRRLAKSHGYYLQHAKEICLVGKKGFDPPGTRAGGVSSDVIYAPRRGQSQKPTEIYEMIEELVPNGRYLELFARKNNLRDFWVSVGNEITGKGLPQSDLENLERLHFIPNAKYGKPT